MADEEKQGTIQFTLPMSQKTSYVKAAQAEGKKLVPWILEQLDRAAKNEKQ
ncbi:hypothetical protein QRD40_10960 [Comamonas sp. Y6]|uniref:Toxin-antitoxin system HicB family antitoxin n=1 Tax=Comamonas resistens TaxID=3046670 RepID=A0ABY8T0M7_9BURK|nr:hypothetical protein [Comamonas resistens]MDL5036866.1 hypothetical protein [Comamonas resistens]WHS67176.1 hypothetical protein QMY55_08675 [Comamonas resistens]